jgi:hypothetical protein
MDFTGDFNTYYWKAINAEIAHTRYYCCGCGRIHPRWRLQICELCPGNICDDCQPFHEAAAETIHKRPQVRPIILIESTVAAMPAPPPPPAIPHYVQRRFRSRLSVVKFRPKPRLPSLRQQTLPFTKQSD